MLAFISWGRFLTALLLSTGLYYFLIILLYFRKEAVFWLRKRAGLTAAGALAIGLARAQDGNVGISQANTMIRGYYDTGTQLLYAVGAVLALIGAIRVFREWNQGHQDQAYRAAAGWFGSCIFLVVVATVIRSFFGL
ncbi:MAG TPA: DUF4134 domain-containing protein [Puia sp.]|jgi:hypothetical protein|nr:DUF4134 domain-containing protein [Puia sp.]